MPSSSALSMIAKLSASLVCGPKFIVPRHSRLTSSRCGQDGCIPRLFSFWYAAHLHTAEGEPYGSDAQSFSSSSRIAPNVE